MSRWYAEFRALQLGDRVGIILQALQVLAIVAGGAWFIFEYRANVSNRAREESLKYAVKAYDTELVKALAAMQKPFEDHELTRELRSAIKTSYSTKDICPVDGFYRGGLAAAYYSDKFEKTTFYNRLSELIVFYTSLSICANSGACDLDAACDFFFADTKQLITRHCTYFDRRTIVYGYSPIRDIEHFLRSCAALERFKVPSLTYCEDVRNAAGKEIGELYQACQ